MKTSSDGATRAIPCGYCGTHHGTICPRIKAVEYHQDGTYKRVEFFAPNDYRPLSPVGSSAGPRYVSGDQGWEGGWP